MAQLDDNIATTGEILPEAVAEIRAFFAYQGDNPKYLHRAKVAAGVIGAYFKGEATKTNRMAIALAMEAKVALPAHVDEVSKSRLSS